MFTFGEWMILVFVVLGAVAVFGLFDINGKVDDLMATLQDVQTDLQAITDGVATLATEIADLKAKVAAGSPVTQADLDALDVKAKAIVDAETAAK